MKKKITTIEGFDGEVLHSALDIKDDVMVIGFRYRDKSKKMDDLILTIHNSNIQSHIGTEFSFSENNKTYFVEKNKGLLVDISERWSLEDLNLFCEEIQNLLSNGVPKAADVYEEVRSTLKRHIELEQETDYSLVAAWIIGTYFFPAFSAYPFLHAKAPKRSGKSQFLDLLRQLCFNATKARPTLAALGDTVESLHGTFLIDQADSLGSQNNEELLEILTGSYKKNGSKRRIMSPDKKARQVIEFETYCPKVFASIKELPEDLQDRCLVIPLIRSDKNFSDPNDDNASWPILRSRLYRFQIGTYEDVSNEYIIRRAIYRQNNDIVGRHLELWLPFEVILRVCGVSEDEVATEKNRFLSQYKFTESELGELDAVVIDVVLESMESADEIVLAPKRIAESLDKFGDQYFDLGKTDRQKAGLVGFSLRRMNLSSEKRPRTKDGVSYLFTREKVERIRKSYFPTLPTLNAKTPEIIVETSDVESSVEL
jgi:hypothetical protein